jgi:dUTP pyrophosphatase
MSIAKVKVKLVNENAVVPFKVHDSDFCFDCTAVSEEEIAPNVWKYDLGIAFEIGEIPLLKDDFILSIDARPRSSIYKTGMILSNSVGTIDVGFINTVSVIFYHFLTELPRYRVGDRVCQIKVGLTPTTEFKVVDKLSATKRGLGGFGSTGR